ncbi:MAG: DedA family protein [Deltaproteobacteria bacterium]|nr:DedA family protein [Deltaproteobacteria bacterium]
MLELIRSLVDFILHIDKHLVKLAAELGAWLYVVLFGIVFCETGLVILPLLPGDSLLFATGALIAAPGSPLDLGFTLALLIAAAILGDAVNYAIGAYVGPQVFTERSRLLNPKYVLRTEAFYAKYGKKTIFLARFVPIVRTFAPFLAGIGRMPYREFAVYNVTGAIAWVSLCTLAGYFFGRIPFVQRYFSSVILAIVVVSVLPIVFELVKAKLEERRSAAA